MILKEVYENSAYLIDEEMSASEVVAAANGGIAVVNTKLGTNLPLFTNENYQAIPYDAISSSWVLRLLEPYITWYIYSNDGVDNIGVLEFHYNRFLSALSDFGNLGLGSIKTTDADGNDTGYLGTAKKSAQIIHNTTVNPFRGWWN